MRIKKFAGGGGYNYIAINRGTGEAASSKAGSSASSSSDDSSKVPGFAKEVIDMLQSTGIQSDVDKFLTQ